MLYTASPAIQWQLDDLHLRRALFNYVSFATMASLGYSDVTAVAPIANILTWLEAMTAQFYLAVVIAQTVGMKIAQVVGAGGPGRTSGGMRPRGFLDRTGRLAEDCNLRRPAIPS